MEYTRRYLSPLGEMLMAGEGDALTGLWFAGQAHYAETLDAFAREGSLEVFSGTAAWLDRYFAGLDPGTAPPVRPGGNGFGREVWECLRSIPYGQTVTYGQIAERIALERGIERMSAQAVGRAVGRNPIALILPCHRVIGADGRLTGYAGGLARKQWLLLLEKKKAPPGPFPLP